MIQFAIAVIVAAIATYISLASPRIKVGNKSTLQGYAFRAFVFSFFSFTVAAIGLSAITPTGLTNDHVFGMLLVVIPLAIIWPIAYAWQCKRYRSRQSERSAFLG